MSRKYYRHLIQSTFTPANPLFANAVAYYKLDETSGFAIDSINGYNGTSFGGITRGVGGKIGSAYDFDGSTSYISIDDQDDFSFVDLSNNNVPFTIRMWVNFDSTTNNPRLLVKRKGFVDLEFLTLINNGYPEITLADSSGNLITSTGQNLILTNQWYHLVFTKGTALDNSDMKIFTNGIEQNNTRPLQTYNGNFNGAEPLFFGAGRDGNSNPSNFLDGISDELCIIKGEAWTPTQVTEDYNNGLGLTI